MQTLGVCFFIIELFPLTLSGNTCILETIILDMYRSANYHLSWQESIVGPQSCLCGHESVQTYHQQKLINAVNLYSANDFLWVMYSVSSCYLFSKLQPPSDEGGQATAVSPRPGSTSPIPCDSDCCWWQFSVLISFLSMWQNFWFSLFYLGLSKNNGKLVSYVIM